MFFGPHPKPSQWLNCGPVFRRILWMCLFLQLLNGKMFNFWTSEVGRPGFHGFQGGKFCTRRMVVFNHHDMLLMIFHQWRAMVSYQKFIYGNGYWMMIQGWSKLLAILRFPAISSKTAGANEILNPAVQVGTLLGMTSVTVRWLWVKVLDEYIGWFQLCYICLIIIQCIICIFTNIYIYSDIEQNLQNDKPVRISRFQVRQTLLVIVHFNFIHLSQRQHIPLSSCSWSLIYPIGSMYALYGKIYHQYTPNVSIYSSTMDPMAMATWQRGALGFLRISPFLDESDWFCGNERRGWSTDRL